MTISLRYAARSDVGLLRDGNEDSVYAGPRLLAIADGMGGHVAGEVASSIVIATLAHLDEDAPGSDLLGALDGATHAANDYLRDMVSSDPHLEGMGTTLTAMLVDRGRLGLVHIGDSRGYLLREGELAQITHDHSLVQSLVDDGRISADEASHHPQRSLILRALDGRDDIEPDLSVRELRVGDRYLLCTDGLSDVVSEATICDTLLAAGEPQEAVDRLVDLALRGGGPDNVTVIVADVVDESAVSHEVLIAGAAAAADGDAHRGHPDTPAGRAALAAKAAKPPKEPTDAAAEHDTARFARRPHRRHRTTRLVAVVTVVVLLVAGAVLGAFLYVRAQYYVGAAQGEVAILRGVSGSFIGVPLHSVYSRSGLSVDRLPQYEREQVSQGINAADLPHARRIVARLQSEACYPTVVPPAPTTFPTPTSTAKHGGTATPTPSASPPGATSPTPSPCPAVTP